MATVYRTVDALEQVGALERGTAYQLCEQKKAGKCCMVELEDSSTVELDVASIQKVIENGMQKCGLSNGMKIKEITWIQEE